MLLYINYLEQWLTHSDNDNIINNIQYLYYKLHLLQHSNTEKQPLNKQPLTFISRIPVELIMIYSVSDILCVCTEVNVSIIYYEVDIGKCRTVYNLNLHLYEEERIHVIYEGL